MKILIRITWTESNNTFQGYYYRNCKSINAANERAKQDFKSYIAKKDTEIVSIKVVEGDLNVNIPVSKLTGYDKANGTIVSVSENKEKRKYTICNGKTENISRW